MKRFLLAGILACLFYDAVAQGVSPESDLALVREKNFQASPRGDKKYNRAGNDANMMKVRSKSSVAEYNPVSLLLKGTMYAYQNVISPQLSRGCPYEITCSNFSKHAIHEFGIVKGVFVTADRILRCNRIGILDVRPLSINEHNGTIADPLSQYRLK